MADAQERQELQGQGEQKEQEKSADQRGDDRRDADRQAVGQPAADQRPTAFEDAVYGKRGWGLTRGDVLFALLMVVAAVALCAVLWVGYGVQGIPGLPTAADDEPGAGVSTEDTSGMGSSGTGLSDADIPDAAWSPDAPDAIEASGAADEADAAGTLDGLDAMAGTFGTGSSGGAASAAPGGTSGSVSGGASSGAAAQSLVAVVQNTKGFYQVLPLDTDVRVIVESDLGTNIVEVSGGRVRCLESDCANQVCVDTGWVATVGAMIVCLPHELTVQVVADAADAAPLV